MTAPKRRNPNRWRFYLLLALLALIAGTVVWVTVGREAFATFMEDRRGGAEQTEVTGEPDSDAGPGAAGGADGGADDQAPGTTGSQGGGTTGPDETGGGEAAGTVPVDAEPDEHALANPVQCRTDALAVTVDAGPRTHPAGAAIPVAVTVANTGLVPCLVDLGHESMRIDITSGDDDIWSSADCPRGDASRDLLLDIDAEVQHTITWEGHRCSSGDSAEEGTYRITVFVPGTGGAAQTDQVIELT